uniref:(California timema) hypothetical protein n=1 Tax=Timema californicum TaxID=61474 RepID=A0A7R9J6K2_TIMCA|nr:unnamed protein product [Timema californicum]
MIEPYNETMLMHAVYTEGPICVALNGSPDDFHHYSEGVYTNYKVCDPNTLTHAATLCGFGTENGLDYWLLKNSWGTDWGEDGYIKVMRQNNTCGVDTAACYPIVL